MSTVPAETTPRPSLAPTSPWSPLRLPAYRWFWLACFASYVGLWMQNVGAAWLMATLTRSPLMISAVQFATSLPVFLFSLPAGVLADSQDRPRLILVTYVWMLGVALATSIATFSGHIGPITLLIATALLGMGSAMSGPALQASVADLVPRTELSKAVMLGGVAFNTARSVGPALAGAILVSLSPAWVFVASSLSVIGMLRLVRTLPHRPPQTGPTERLLSGMRAGLRYARNAPGAMAPLVRSAGFGLCASALWALLPLLIARDGAGSAGGFGLLVGCLGGGAVLSAFVATRLKVVADSLTFRASLLYAAVMTLAAWTPWVPVLCGLMVAAGAGWALTLNTAYASLQSGLPAWVRARALALYALLLQGSMAIGSLLWGAVAESLGVPAALMIAALSMTAIAYYTRWRFRLVAGTEAQVTPMAPWIEFSVAGDLDPDEGPVAVEIEYRIDPQRSPEFIAASRAVSRARKRAGATAWRLYRDLEMPGCFRERFIVDSWAEYLRSRSRATVADREREQVLRGLHAGERPPRVTHSIGAR